MGSLFLSGMAISCSTSQTDVKTLDGKWTISSVRGAAVKQEGKAFMTFDMAENKLHGNGGCNIFNTSLTLNDKDISAIRINPAAATMMSCPNADQETTIFQAMDAVRSVKAGEQANEMLLLDEAGTTVLGLKKN